MAGSPLTGLAEQIPAHAPANRRMSGRCSTGAGKQIGETARPGAELVCINLEPRGGKEEENLPGGRCRHPTPTCNPQMQTSGQYPGMELGYATCIANREYATRSIPHYLPTSILPLNDKDRAEP